MPMFEEACHLHGQCKMDMDHIQHIAEWALNNTMAGDWNHTEYALHRMVEVFGEAKKDCDDHPTPPSPEECEKAEWVMEDTLQGLIASVGDKYAEGAEHFSAELEHRVFWIERACQLHDMCKLIGTELVTSVTESTTKSTEVTGKSPMLLPSKLSRLSKLTSIKIVTTTDKR